MNVHGYSKSSMPRSRIVVLDMPLREGM